MSSMKRAKSNSVDPEPKWLTKARELGNVVSVDGPKRLAPVDVLEPMPTAAELFEEGVRVERALAHDAEVPPGIRERAARTLIEVATRGKIGGEDGDLSPEEIDRRLQLIEDRVAARRAEERQRLSIASLPAVVTEETGETKAEPEGGEKT